MDIHNTDDRNFSIESEATIDSSDVAFDTLIHSKNISNKVVVKLNSLTKIDVAIYHNNKSSFKNEGPFPPEVGKETQYTVVWTAKNYFNDISNATIKAFLPTGVRWTGKIFPENENISFNTRTNEIVWNIGKVPAGTGILSPPKRCEFQIAVTPQPNQQNRNIPLLGETIFSSKDDFTLSNITVKFPARNTENADSVETDNL